MFQYIELLFYMVKFRNIQRDIEKAYYNFILLTKINNKYQKEIKYCS